MEVTAKIEGLEAVLRTMEQAFPKNAKVARSLLNQTMSGSSRKSILPMAKSLALIGDGSGALSQSLAPRAVSASRARRKGKSASVEITPVRYDKEAIAKYTRHYYKGGTTVARVAEGIRHGHLVEFGTVRSQAYPFLYPALRAGKSAYIGLFAQTLEKKIMARVRREAKKAGKF